MGFLLDTALGWAARLPAVDRYRVATVHMKIQFTGAPASGPVTAHAGPLGPCEQTALPQALSSATLVAGKTVIAHSDGILFRNVTRVAASHRAVRFVGRSSKQNLPELDALEDMKRRSCNDSIML